jgi:tetratricopeptide (TPR) repeat protein
MSFEQGEQKVQNFKDDYNEILPVFKYNNDKAVKVAASDMDRTLTKMGKTIKLHSITVKPHFKGALTQRDKELLKKNEYCKWIDDAYLLIGKANFYKRKYNKALRAFRRILNIYKNEDTRYPAQLWIAKVYLQQKKYKEAYNYLTKLASDKQHPQKLDKDINLTFADYFIRTKNYNKAIEYLKKSIKLTKKRKEKSRYYYILAQLEHLQNNNDKASEYYKKVIKMNTNYDMTFNAKIKRASVLSAKQNSKQLRKKIKKLLKDEKNENYKDQIYYALAMIDLKNKDTSNAIKNLILSGQNSVDNNSQKAISYLKLADIYFKKKDFINSGKYYDSTMQYLSPKFPNYNKITQRAKNTGELVKYLETVQTQDSLQRIAKMPAEKRNKIIDNLIQQVIEQEQRQSEYNNYYYNPNDISNNYKQSSSGGKWYMYNQILLSRGKSDFIRKWGNRKLEDNWRRKNKAAVNQFAEQNNNNSNDSSKITNKKSRKYYLQNLPLNDSLMAISNSKIQNALFNAADVYQYKLSDKKSAIKLYKKLILRYPKSDFKLEAYYRLYLLYKSLNNKPEENLYKQKIINEFPESKYAKMLKDPNFANKLLANENQSLDIYQLALSEYNKNNYIASLQTVNKGLKKYAESDAYPYFLFLKAKNFGNLNQKDSLVFYLSKLRENYPQLQIARLANEILSLIASGKLNYNIYSFNPSAKYCYILLINKKLNSTELQFRLKSAAANFSDTKTYTIKSQNFNKIFDLISIKYFDNLNKAKKFLNTINQNQILNDFPTSSYFSYIISDSNLSTLLKDKNIDKYDYFYKRYLNK